MKILIPFLVLGALIVGSAMLDRPSPRGDLVVSYTSIQTLDPQVTSASEDVRMAYALFEGIVTFNPYTMAVEPGVAKSWEIDDTGLRFTFHLNENAHWSDGHPVTADDFIYAWRVGLLPDTAPPYMKFLHYIKGGEAFTDWATESLAEVREFDNRTERLQAAQRRAAEMEAKFVELVGIEKIDDRTLIVEADRHVPYFLEIMATWPLFPLPRHVVEPVTTISPDTGMMRRDPQWIKAGRMVSNGPFKLTDWRFKRDIYMTRNEHYWNVDEVALETLQFLRFSDYPTLFVAYESGMIDLAVGVEPLSFLPDLIDAQERGERNDVHSFSAFGTYYFSMNMQENVPNVDENPMRDVRVRKALAMSIAKEPIGRNVTRMNQRPATTFVPPGVVEGYDSPAGLPYDPDQARALLAEAGYPDGEGFPPLTLTYNTGGGHERVAQVVSRAWQQELGIRIGLEPSEWPTFLERRRQGDFHIARNGWFGDYSDPTTMLDLLRSGNPHNNSFMADEHYDALLDEAEAERDPEKRLELLAEAERYMLEEVVPIVPIYVYRVSHLFDPDEVQGVSMHPRNLQMYKHMRGPGSAPASEQAEVQP
ncbi:MAG: peptide ABC transporter substrate-binding protein [Phycisphaeraceae bacterium]